MKNMPPKDGPFHWSVLTPAEMKDIEGKIVGALESLGVNAITTEWKGPGPIPHWILVAESVWCANNSAATIARMKAHAIQKSEILMPSNGLVLRKPPKEDFNQAAFRAIQETGKK